MENMLTVQLFRGGKRVAEIEAETPEGALLGARTIYDETLRYEQGTQGEEIALLFLDADEQPIRRVVGRP